jgi:hypothetical protein
MELQRATKEGVLELDRISAKIGSTVNAVWGTIEGDITKQLDLPAIDGGDSHFIQVNLMEIKNAANNIPSLQFHYSFLVLS